MIIKTHQIKIPRFTLIGCFFAFSSGAVAQTSMRSSQPGIMPVLASGSIEEKIIIAIASGAISFISGYILLEIKERRSPRKRLSYDLKVKKGLVSVDDEISDDISLYYKGRAASNLSYVRVDIKNTGSTVVKNELIRFHFNDDSTVLNVFQDPVPPPEIGLTQTDGEHNNYRYKISHIERLQSVSFCFVVESPGEVSPEMHPFNEEGDVEFTASSIAKETDEQTKLEMFIYLSILCLFFAVWASMMPGGWIAFNLLFGVFFISVNRLVRPVSRIIAATLLGIGQGNHPLLNIKNDKEGSITVNIEQSRNRSA